MRTQFFLRPLAKFAAVASVAAILGTSVQANEPVVIASDNASSTNYPSGWTNGSNGGTGFGPWTISSDPGTGYAGANTHTKQVVLVWLPRVSAILSIAVRLLRHVRLCSLSSSYL